MTERTATATSERVVVHAFVDRHVRVGLERLARDGDRTLSAEIRRALAAHVHNETEES
jgi:hypothetical protein